MSYRRGALVLTGVLGAGLLSAGAASPDAAVSGAPTPVLLSSAETADHTARIETIANDLDAAYLVAPGPQADQPEVVAPGATPEQGAAALAEDTNLNEVAEGSVADNAELHEDVRASMTRANDAVLDSQSEVQKISAVKNADGTETITADVYFKRQLQAGSYWEEVIPYVVSFNPASAEYTNLQILNQDPVADPTPAPSASSLSSSGGGLAARQLDRTKADVNLLSLGASGKEKAAAYAETWWNRRNPSWGSFSNDCANFVSQSFYAGGWPMIKDLATYKNGWPVTWFYVGPNHNANQYSLSWTASEEFYGQALWSNGRVYNTRDRYALRRGDILQWKTPDNNNKMSHSTIVTGFTTEPLLTYHSTDRHNLPLSAAIALLAGQYPGGGVLWYPLGVY